MELKITKERILEAASKCTAAKETLKTLFPEVFSMELISKDMTDLLCLANIGSIPAIHIANGIRMSQYGEKTHFFLSPSFGWKIEQDGSTLFLIPTKKGS